MIYYDIEQGSDEWHAVRCGKITASRLDDVMAEIKSGEAATRRGYRAELVAERLGGKVDKYVSPAMRWGTEQEPYARAAYEVATGNFVDQIGFADHPTIPMCGASPDGLIGEEGVLEIKCPNTATHLSYLRNGVVPAEYLKQTQWNLEVLGRKWLHFVSFDPRLPRHLQLFIRVVKRDDKFLDEARKKVREFNSDVESDMEKLLHCEPIRIQD